MRVFNRLIVVLLLAGLVALGVFAALYGFGLFGYRVASLSRAWESFKSALRGTVGGVENGAPAIIAFCNSSKLARPDSRTMRSVQGSVLSRSDAPTSLSIAL